ncbi:MAG: type II toxin-antitoxin system RelE/ParE family toxin [Candidatus Thermoplasmatota archaeon]|nr:type II toxin-antitoxin system RelE/ParE family toxin [Candidatus Thermoplasmatota archaeon]
MTYKVKLHPNVAKFLEKASRDIADRVKDKLRQIRENPFHYLEHYAGEDVHKLRIGDYRALIDVDTRHHILYVQVIDRRDRIYKR